MLTVDTIRHTLRPLQDELRDTYGIERLYLFGSYAKHQATPHSDIDILVDFEKTPDLLTFLQLEELLSKTLQAPVDLVPKRKLKERLKQTILNEAIAL